MEAVPSVLTPQSCPAKQTYCLASTSIPLSWPPVLKAPVTSQPGVCLFAACFMRVSAVDVSTNHQTGAASRVQRN